MNDAVIWNEIGNIYLKIGSHKDAIAAYTKAIELNPDSGWAYCSLGQAYFLVGEFGHALFLFRKSIQLMATPENQAVVWNKIGDAYRALKDIDNAIQAYKKADALDMGASMSEENIGRQPDNQANIGERINTGNIVPDTNGLSSVPIKTPAPSQSTPEIQAIADGFQPVNVDKANEENFSTLDLSETKPIVLPKPNGNTDQDNSALPKEKSLIVFPESNDMAENLPNKEETPAEPEHSKNSKTAYGEDKTQGGKSKGSTNTSRGIEDLEEILAKVNIYENITRVNPTNDRGWDTLGKLYKALGRYEDAINAYQKAIAIAPDREVYFYYLGLLFSVEQQNDDAIQAFQFVLSKNPEYVLAHSALAGVYHRMGLENKANHHIAIALPKMNAESTYNRACFYVICGDKELAFEFLSLALKNKETTIEWIKSDPDLDPIRTDQRFQELISEKDQPATENSNGNYFSSEMEGKPNQLLPILNHSLTR